MLDADEIKSGCDEEIYVVRVHDESSVSPLKRGGFYAGRQRWQNLTNGQWRDWYQDLYYDENFERSLTTSSQIRRHVTHGWGCALDHSSDWISTTQNFEWAVWEVARRLARMGWTWVETSVIRGMHVYPEDFSGVKAIGFTAYDILRNSREPGTQKARWFARASSEVVWYGRIFERDVYQTDKWTWQRAGVKLPDHFFSPWTARRGKTWLDSLVWNPYSREGFYSAANKIEARRQKLEIARAERR